MSQAGLTVVQDVFCAPVTADVKSDTYPARGWDWRAEVEEGQPEEAVARPPTESCREYEMDGPNDASLLSVLVGVTRMTIVSMQAEYEEEGDGESRCMAACQYRSVNVMRWRWMS